MMQAVGPHNHWTTTRGSRQAHCCRGVKDLLIETGDRGERSDPIEAVRDLFDRIGYESWLREQTDKPALLERRLENVRELVAWLDRFNTGCLMYRHALMIKPIAG